MNQHRAKAGWIGAALALAGSFGGTASAAGAPHHLGKSDLAPIAQICERVVRVAPGEAHYNACVAALAESRPARSVSQGDASFGRVVAASDRTDAVVGGPSYFYASPRESVRRNRVACAQLGVQPVGPDMERCVVLLTSALAAADNPQD
jgi:hypothetical protein